MASLVVPVIPTTHTTTTTEKTKKRLYLGVPARRISKWWDSLLQLVFSKAFLGLISIMIVVGLASAGRLILPFTQAMIFPWALESQATGIVILLFIQRVLDWRARQGKVFAARALLVPAFEKVIWAMLVLTLGNLAVLTSNFPNTPYFWSVIFDGAQPDFSDYLFCFLYYMFSACLYTFEMFFLFLEGSLSYACFVRSAQRSLLTSAIQSSVSTVLVVLAYERDLPWAMLLAREVPFVSGFGACCFLTCKALRSSRKSILPFSIASAVACLYNAALIPFESSDESFLLQVVRVIVPHVMFNFFVYWSLSLDTKYWRGVARVPIWRETSQLMDPLDDNVIQKDLPLLLTDDSFASIDFAFLRFGEVIGTGATSRVYKGSLCVGPLKGRHVAVKVFTPVEMTSDTLIAIANEIHKYERLHHPRVMHVIGVCVRPPDVCMVCELCEEGSLHQFLHTHVLTVHQKMKLSIQVAEAVAFIHSLSPPLIHRDLKSLNFLVTESGDVKLSDFGTSRELPQSPTPTTLTTSSTATTPKTPMSATSFTTMPPPTATTTTTPQRKPSANNSNNSNRNHNNMDIDNGDIASSNTIRLSTRVGSIQWMSPEVMAGCDNYDLKADVYSLGVVLWEIWAQQTPYDGMPKRTIASHVLSSTNTTTNTNTDTNTSPLPKPQSCPLSVWQIMCHMFARNPTLRPTARDVLCDLQAICLVNCGDADTIWTHLVDFPLT